MSTNAHPQSGATEAGQAPLVSILIPTYNRAEYLDDCLHSVLCQDFRDFEVVIRDNCSTDNTDSVVKKYESKFNIGPNYRYIRNETNVGFRQNLRDGITQDCRGKYCINLHDDDFFLNEKLLSHYVNILESNPNVSFVCSFPLKYDQDVETVSAKDLIAEHLKDQIAVGRLNIDGRDYFLNFWTKYPVINFSATLFKTKLAVDRNWVDYGCLDQSLALLLSAGNEVVFVRDSLTAYRMHTSPERGNVTWRVTGLPVEAALESHDAIEKWVSFSRSSLGLSRLSALVWRLKTLISKEGYTIGILHNEDGDKDIEFLRGVKKRSLFHYLVLRWLEPTKISLDAASGPKNPIARVLHQAIILLRRRASALLVGLDRVMHDPDHNLSPGQALRWVFTGSSRKANNGATHDHDGEKLESRAPDA